MVAGFLAFADTISCAHPVPFTETANQSDVRKNIS